MEIYKNKKYIKEKEEETNNEKEHRTTEKHCKNRNI